MQSTRREGALSEKRRVGRLLAATRSDGSAPSVSSYLASAQSLAPQDSEFFSAVWDGVSTARRFWNEPFRDTIRRCVSCCAIQSNRNTCCKLQTRRRARKSSMQDRNGSLSSYQTPTFFAGTPRFRFLGRKRL